MHRLALHLLSSASIVLAAASAWAGSYVYTPIVVGTDPYSVQLNGINESDTVVGTQTVYVQTKNPHVYTHSERGFVWRNGSVTFFAAPAGATFVGAGKINRYGVALAHDTLADGTSGSFTYDTTTGATRQLSVPGASSVNAFSISNGGSIAGGVTIGAGGVSHSFVIDHGVAMIFDPPGALSSAADFVRADGTVSGTFYVADPKVTSGYVYKNGVFTILNSPFGTPFEGYAGTSAGYVGGHGVVLGSYDEGIASVGFIYHDGVYSTPLYNTWLMRVLGDGTVFGVMYGTNNYVQAFGPHAGHAPIAPPGVFTEMPSDVNESGDFVGSLEGVIQDPYGVYYENFIATCPAGQAPCY